MSEEKKQYDTMDRFEMMGARIQKDAEVTTGDRGKMVRLTILSTSRRERNSPAWFEVNVSDFQAEIASYLKKGDVLHRVGGKFTLRKYGENESRIALGIERAELDIPIDLFMALKERGFTPGAGKGAAGKPAVKTFVKKAPRPVVDLDDED